MIRNKFFLLFGKFIHDCKCRMSEIEYVPGGKKVIKSVCITTDNPRLSPPCPPATHPQIWNPLEYEKKTFQKAQQTYRQCAHPQMWNPPKYEKHFKWRNIPVFLKKTIFYRFQGLVERPHQRPCFGHITNSYSNLKQNSCKILIRFPPPNYNQNPVSGSLMMVDIFRSGFDKNKLL